MAATGHRIHNDLGAAVSGQGHLVRNPGTGNVINMEGKSDALVTLSAGTYKLPNSPVGRTLTVVATGTVILQTQGGSSIQTIVSGQVLKLVADTTSSWTPESGALYDSATGTEKLYVPITTVLKQDGTVMAKQATTVTGFSQLSNKNIVIHIPANSTAESFSFGAALPANADTSSAITVTVYASKDADADSLTLDLELYANGNESGWGSDLYAGSAVAVEQDGSGLTYSCSAPDAPQLAGVLTLGGTNDGDVTYIHGIAITYSKKLLTS